MKLRTSLQLSAIFPIVFAIVITLSARPWQHAKGDMGSLDTAFLGVAGILGLAMAGVILFYSRDILRKLSVLNQWIDAVLKGNLDQPTGIPSSDDEVGRLSQSLSRMLAELKEAYSNVHQESVKHKQEALDQKKGAEASLLATKHLSEALGRIKESHAADVQKERLHVLEQIIRGTTHDFSEAMMPIVGTCDLLLMRPEMLDNRDQALDHIRAIHGGAERAKKLLKNLAGFFRAGDEPEGPTDPNLVIDQAVNITRPYWREQSRAKGRGVNIQTSLEMVPSVGVEEGDLRDCYIHLIMNAVEAMPNGGVISVSSRVEHSFVIVEVRDTGRGMSGEILDRCTEPFYSTKNGVGTGMGLTIVNSVVRRHRGRLEIESKPGAGTRISMRLPVWAAVKRDTGAAADEQQVGKKLRILVVDDEPLSREIVRKALTCDGHPVEVAAGGQDGVEKMKASKFDLAIIDRAMPGMHGDEMAVAIKKLEPGMPVVMLTGFGDIMAEEGEVPENVDVVLSKPITVSDLRHALAKALAHRVTAKTVALRDRFVSSAPKASAPAEPKRVSRGSGSKGQTTNGKSFTWVD